MLYKLCLSFWKQLVYFEDNKIDFFWPFIEGKIKNEVKNV